jgi:hypothetical protein
VSRIRSRTLKFQVPHSLSPHIATFYPRALFRSSVTLETIVPLLPLATLNPDPRARRCLILDDERLVLDLLRGRGRLIGGDLDIGEEGSE